jgi:MoaA/NifB/PqqE/SkfB family radical SAM enzyme
MANESYTAASVAIPGKVLAFSDLIKHNIGPIHVQLSPTNKCNLNCAFCSCAGRDKSAELLAYQIAEFYNRYKDTIKSTTITGGGEPLLHPDIKTIIEICHAYGDVGMVSNGYLLPKAPDNLDKLTWLRVSASRYIRPEYVETVKAAMLRFPKIDWAISFVCSDDTESDMIALDSIIDGIGLKDLTHIRVVSDILAENDNTIEAMSNIVKYSDSKIILQKRAKYTRGDKNCWISRVKPMIDATGDVLPCCGYQYAVEGKERQMPKEMIIGHINDPDSWDTFNGSICDKCYYKGYNQLIEAMVSTYKHATFI